MPRPRVVRERALELRLRVLVLRGFFAALVERLAVERLVAVLRAGDKRLAAEVDERALVAVERFAVDRFAVERLAVERDALLRRAAVLRAAGRAALARAGPSSDDHLPDITRCAASATASAMIDPNLVALAIMLVAALEALSAASRPASRILRRAAGLALIAAAAAARPAASISLLIAALASLSTVVSRELDLDREELDREDLFFGDFAIALSPSVAGKAL